jgi:hypothetical protein
MGRGVGRFEEASKKGHTYALENLRILRARARAAACARTWVRASAFVCAQL